MYFMLKWFIFSRKKNCKNKLWNNNEYVILQIIIILKKKNLFCVEIWEKIMFMTFKWYLSSVVKNIPNLQPLNLSFFMLLRYHRSNHLFRILFWVICIWDDFFVMKDLGKIFGFWKFDFLRWILWRILTEIRSKMSGDSWKEKRKQNLWCKLHRRLDRYELWKNN